MVETIHISEVTRVIQESPTNEHTLSFVRATGKLKGSIKTCQVRKSVQRKKRQGKSRRKYDHKDHWTVPLWDVKANRIVTPRFTNIIEFNGKKVMH